MKLGQAAFPERARFGLSLCLTLFLVAFLSGCDRAGPMGFRSGSPLGDLPPWIISLQDFGVRPDWSGDSARLVYLDALVGNVFEVELATGSRRSLTEHFPHHGFTRARYLANGALLLCGPGSANPDSEGVDAAAGAVGDRWHTELFYLPSDGGAAQSLGEPCFEGPAVSRLGMTIAWTRSDYPRNFSLLDPRSGLAGSRWRTAAQGLSIGVAGSVARISTIWPFSKPRTFVHLMIRNCSFPYTPTRGARSWAWI